MTAYRKPDDHCTMYYCTFTFYKWLSLFEIVNRYDIEYKWVDHLKKEGYYGTGYETIPGRVHVILYFPEAGFNHNKIMSKAKEFLGYEITKLMGRMKRRYK